MENTIKVVLVEEHQLLRVGMRLLLADNPAVQIVAESDFSTAIETVTSCNPDVVWLGLVSCQNHPRQEIITEILQAYPATHILILGNSCEDKNVLQAFRQGAMGCLLRDSTQNDVLHAIRALADGGSYLPPTVGRKIIQGYTHSNWARSQDVPKLSSQQLLVLRYIAQGFTNQEIADILVISKRTVEMHVYKIFKKLKVNNRTQVIQAALRWELIDVLDWPSTIDQQQPVI
jgi:DNA-binding NarL/FixJ family response regulator